MMDSTDIPDDQFDRVVMLRDMKEAHVTGSNDPFESQTYASLRTALIQDPNIRDIIPTCVKTCRTGSDIWAYFKIGYETDAEIRSCIKEEFEPLLQYLELPDSKPETQPARDIKAGTLMYSLIVTGDSEAWNRSAHGVDRGWLGEHTEDSIHGQFRDSTAQLSTKKTCFLFFVNGWSLSGMERMFVLTRICLRRPLTTL